MGSDFRAAAEAKHLMKLNRGDTVGVVAPGFAVRAADLRAGAEALEAMGFRVRLGPNVLARNGYLAGNDELRADDLNSMIRAREVQALWFARGGYGTARLLSAVAWRALRRHPKLLIGYSDLTALFARALRVPEQRCLYGPVVTELGRPEQFHRGSLARGLRGEEDRWKFLARQVWSGGKARGRLIGGNLTVLGHLCGTPFAPRYDGAVLFLEDVAEPTYRIDRMLTQLRDAGALRRVAAVLLGEIAVTPRKNFPPDRAIEDVLREFLEPLGVPVVAGFPAGHVAGKRSLPLGATAELDTSARCVRFVP